MYIIILSLLAGIVTVLLAGEFLVRMKSFQLEREVSEKIGGIRAFRLKGLTGNLLYLSEKVGSLPVLHRSKQLQPVAHNIQKALTILGAPYSSIQPYTFIGIQLLSGILLVILFLVLLNTWNIVLLAAAGAAGFYLPYALLQQKVKERHKAIFRQIPDLLDLMAIMVEAGLDFNGALKKVTETEQGVLIDELRKVQQEIRLGKARADAFNDMALRIAYLPVNTMVNSFTLSFQTGASIAPALKTLSEQFRVERTQLAEKLANEAPLKLLAPLIILIFPTIFIILFGPILLSFIGSH